MANLVNFFKVIVLSLCFILCLWANVFAWPEFWLSSDCSSGPAYGKQYSPSVAFDGTNFLVVWEDERISSERDIFAARVSPQGEILDPIGIPVCTAQGLQRMVNVAWGEQNYLVVWLDWSGGSFDVYGARIDADGNVLDPDGFPISTGPWWEMYPDVAWDGTNFFVVWSDDRSLTSSDIYGTRITSDGEILDDRGILISDQPEWEETPSIACCGSTCFVTWEHTLG